MNDREIYLEPLSLQDVPEVYELYTNALVLQNYSSKPIENYEQTARFITKITTEGCWSWKMLLKDKQKFLGICSLHHYDALEKAIEIGGTLFPEFWGKGMMRQAFQLLIEVAKKDFGVNKVLGKTQATNHQAIALTQKMGFVTLHSDLNETIVVKYVN